jgi:sterol desaturase/sphingolipid hydroxylase (fatty acid hydroxylase superfamily)
LRPAQFVLMVALTRAFESLSHANARIHFGRFGEWLLVSPRFHRVHHGIGVGHEGAAVRLQFRRCSFPWWDHALRHRQLRRPEFRARPAFATSSTGATMASGFWRQQWLGILRMGGKA